MTFTYCLLTTAWLTAAEPAHPASPPVACYPQQRHDDGDDRDLGPPSVFKALGLRHPRRACECSTRYWTPRPQRGLFERLFHKHCCDDQQAQATDTGEVQAVDPNGVTVQTVFGYPITYRIAGVDTLDGPATFPSPAPGLIGVVFGSHKCCCPCQCCAPAESAMPARSQAEPIGMPKEEGRERIPPPKKETDRLPQ